MTGLWRFEGKAPMAGRLGWVLCLLGLVTACSGLPEKDRLPTAQSGCLGSVFLRQGQLAKLHLRNVVTIEHPYARFSIREAVISPDLQKIGILAQSGAQPQFTSQVLFFECETQRWHQAYQTQPDTQVTGLTWHPDSNQIAFLEQRAQSFREKGKDWHRFQEQLTLLSWPSFESRVVVALQSQSLKGKGVLSDWVREKAGEILSTQFHPAQSLMVLETRPKNHPEIRVFRWVDLSQAHPDYPTDFKRWFESPAAHQTQLFLTDTRGLRIERRGQGLIYEEAPLGKNTFKAMEVNSFLAGAGVSALYFRDHVLYAKVQTTSRTHILSVALAPEPPVPTDPKRLLASQAVETLFVYEGGQATVGDFDIYLNRVIYSCRPKTTQRNQVCLGTLSDKPVQATAAFAADDDDSIYPVLTYWPRN